jgi:post-segregation antitoxin (ccd killing protein)
MKLPRRKRKVTTITLNPEIVEKAKKYNLNISRLSEDTLKETIRKLEHEAEQMGAPKIGKKGGEKEMTSKLPWAAAVLIVAAVGLGAWAIWGGEPAVPTPPPGTASITGIAGPGTVFGAGIPASTASGIENVYIITPGYTETDNLSGHANIIGVIEADTGTDNIAYDTTFHIVVAVKAGSDNMAYVTVDNMKVGLGITGSFSLTDENAGDTTASHMAGWSHDNNGYGTTSGWLRINAVWDNNGTGYQLPAGGSITLQIIMLWGWA